MHLLRTKSRTADEAEAAVDLGQTPGDILCLSFSDSDLGALAACAETWDGPHSLRLASLAQLRHPYSVDLYLERAAARAKFVLVRLLGGLDYWRYGVDELARAARAQGFALAVVPGCHSEDPRLDAASTLPVADLRRIWRWFGEGGAQNMASLFGWIDARLGAPATWLEPQPLPAAGRYEAGCRSDGEAGHAVVTFYRSLLLSGDCAPVVALADALAARGLRVSALFAASLKDAASVAVLRQALADDPPDVILNTTAFSARVEAGGSVLDAADAPVFQVILGGAAETRWRADPRGLGPADLAMNVVLPEMDGRIVTTAVSGKAESARSAALEFSRLVHRPIASRVAHVADLAANWVRLRRAPASARRLACVLSDYPGRGGREGYAVGLDTPASVAAMAEALRGAGYDIGPLPSPDVIMQALAASECAALPVSAYRALLAGLPPAFAASVCRQWGEPEADGAVRDGTFGFRLLQAGKLTLALQPDRGSRAERKGEYHDTALPPRHAYIAFYLWLRHVVGVHAIVHCGTHGTLEWLPGKPVALDETCAPEALLGATPLIYPFIVNNPGEAAQAKRRTAAVTIGHMTPPLVAAGLDAATSELEALFDEYADAESLDPKRARLIARAILARAEETGIAGESGVASADPDTALRSLDAWLCDIKEMRIRDGLHVFGRPPLAEAGVTMDASEQAGRAACGAAEMTGLLAALDGRFVPGGPAGAPSRGRLDVMPTGRNLYSTDPRAVPSRTAYAIGRQAADEVATRYAQDHGDWPQAIVMDLWASATMRTGGEDLGQAMAHLGVRPLWDVASARVTGFEILPYAALDRPRVDVTLRLSGLFRDVFPAQIALFDQAVQAVALLDEESEINPLAARRREGDRAMRRIFGSAPATYGIGLGRAITADPTVARQAMGEAYLASASHSYGGAAAEPSAAGTAFADRVASADAFVHVQDMDDMDVLDAAASVEAEGGFAAAAESLGRAPALYHLDAGRSDRMTVRTLAEEVARTVRGRAANPAWIAGQMRHGHRGAAEIAETVDNLYAMAVLSEAAGSRQFDLLFAATCGTPAVREFLLQANRDAARAVAERFRDAALRGFWSSRRNSDAACLADMLAAVAA